MSGPFEVSAVIPAHDALPFVLEAVQSALSQTRAPSGIVVVDDSSSDGTGDAVERAFGSRVRVVRGRFGSAAAARNAGWRAARSPWIAFLDADDLWFPDKLETAARELAAHPEAAWFFSDGAFLDLEGGLRQSWLEAYADLSEPYCGHPTAELFEVNFVLTSSVVVRRDALDRTGGFDERMSHAEDLDLWIRLSRGWPATASRRALVRYQHREGGLTRQTEARLLGDVSLFERLAADRELPPALRRRARHRHALAHYKLAVAALREARPAEARGHLRGAWLFPERALAVAAAWAACLLPPALLRRMRGQAWATRGVAAPLARNRRVVIAGHSALPPMAETRRRP
jgi:glycosyltransferase involved in cell wall biosynthesis